MGDDDFLARWSRRKRAVEDEASKPVEVEPEDPPKPEPQSEEDEGELLARLNLPVPETMKPGDDFSVFMSDAVPAFLRKRALRVLWRSNPVLANLDGLNDYDEDFTSPELTQKVLATAYQVGRGIVSEMSSSEHEEEGKEGDVPADDAQSQVDEITEIAAEIQEPKKPASFDEESEPAPRPRRMRFES